MDELILHSCSPCLRQKQFPCPTHFTQALKTSICHTRQEPCCSTGAGPMRRPGCCAGLREAACSAAPGCVADNLPCLCPLSVTSNCRTLSAMFLRVPGLKMYMLSHGSQSGALKFLLLGLQTSCPGRAAGRCQFSQQCCCILRL